MIDYLNLKNSYIKGYYRRIFETAVGKKSTLFMFTATDIIGRTCDLNNDTIYRFHLHCYEHPIFLRLVVRDALCYTEKNSSY